MDDTDATALGDYSAVPAHPNLNNISIEESKFLGGDLEHTHLVKGLDFALLQKVHRRCEQCMPAVLQHHAVVC